MARLEFFASHCYICTYACTHSSRHACTHIHMHTHMHAQSSSSSSLLSSSSSSFHHHHHRHHHHHSLQPSTGWPSEGWPSDSSISLLNCCWPVEPQLATMPQFELTDVGTVNVRLDEISLDPETVWRALDDTRVAEIEQNIMEGNWLASPIEFPVLVGKSNGECFEAKACNLFNVGWCRGYPCTMQQTLTSCIAGRSNRS